MPDLAATPGRLRPYANRLVATWALFFDRLGWRYDVAPFVLNGWSPSFAIRGNGLTTLAEVRAMTTLSPIVAGNALGAANWVPIYPTWAGSPKAVQHSILLLGASPLAPLQAAPASKGRDKASLGWIYDGADAAGVYEGGCGDWQVARLLRLPEVSPVMGFSGLFGNWTDRISGQSFNMMTDRVDCVAPGSIEDLWRDCEKSLRRDDA